MEIEEIKADRSHRFLGTVSKESRFDAWASVAVIVLTVLMFVLFTVGAVVGSYAEYYVR